MTSLVRRSAPSNAAAQSEGVQSKGLPEAGRRDRADSGTSSGRPAALAAAQREQLHVKYRPTTLDGVVGQSHITTNLRVLFESGRIPHTFLFTGPSGTGKTTLARIVARLADCGEVIEHDSARFNSIQAVRELVEGSQYAALRDEAGKKFIIIDECQRISSAAFDVLLKSTEEPPAHLYWAFCTTEPDKIPTTLRTRAHAYDVKPVDWSELAEYLEAISEAEQMHISADFIGIAARRAEGSVRQALVYLSMLEGITDREHALRLVEDFEAQQEGPVQLARLLVKGQGATWAACLALVASLEGVSAETIRLTVMQYVSAVVSKETKPDNARRLLAVLQAFSVPCVTAERMAPIYLALGALLLAE